MRQIEKNTNLSIYVLCTTQIFSICLIIFLLIKELFIDDYVTQRKHARLNRSSWTQAAPDYLSLERSLYATIKAMRRTNARIISTLFQLGPWNEYNLNRKIILFPLNCCLRILYWL